MRQVVKPLCLAILAAFQFGCATGSEKKDNAHALLLLGTKQILDSNYSQAKASLLQAQNEDPDNPIIQNNLGLVYFADQKFDLAEVQFKKALQLDPTYSDARNNLARVYIEITRYDEAIVELKRVLSDLSYRSIEKAYVNLGIAELRRGNFSSALVQFEKARSANENFCPAYNYSGQALFSLQKFDDALESFKTALKLCSKYDEARYFRGLSYYKTGQTEKAKEDLKDFSKLFPGSVYAKKAEDMLQLMR